MSSDKWFVIRADSNKDIGIGHVVRCLALAEWAYDLGIKLVLLIKESNSFITSKVKKLNGEVILLPCVNEPSTGFYKHSCWLDSSELKDAELSLHEIKKFALLNNKPPPLFVVVDHYALASPWESLLKTIAPVLVIDDLEDRRHDCSWLVDQTLGKTKANYKNLTPPSCKLLIGADFALLRKEFSKQASYIGRSLLRSSYRVLITLGGVDKDNNTSEILSWILSNEIASKLYLTIVTGSLNPNLPDLYNYEDLYENVEVLTDVNNMAEVMSAHDLCIGAAGSTSWERCVIGLPTITVVIADNQIEIARNLAREECLINLGKIDELESEKLISSLNQLLENKKLYKQIIKNSRKVCDGYGCERILREVV